MIWSLLCAIPILFGVLACGPNFVPRESQESAPPSLVEIEGLKSEYSSCARVNLAIRNVSKQGVYVDVYVERFASGSWNDDTYPYAINDPASLYSKVVKIDLIKGGGTLSLSYDRCLKPRFVKEDEKTFKRAIEDGDERAGKTGAPTLQRIRVEVHDEARTKVSQRVWSQSFPRRPNAKQVDSPAK